VAITPDGREVWGSNREDDSLSIVDARSMQTLACLRAEGFPIRVHLTRDGNKALVTVARRDQLLIFDVAKRALLLTCSPPAVPT
jgi:DNA-binding beta-propeller fold protein YncE